MIVFEREVLPQYSSSQCQVRRVFFPIKRQTRNSYFSTVVKRNKRIGIKAFVTWEQTFEMTRNFDRNCLHILLLLKIV